MLVGQSPGQLVMSRAALSYAFEAANSAHGVVSKASANRTAGTIPVPGDTASFVSSPPLGELV